MLTHTFNRLVVLLAASTIALATAAVAQAGRADTGNPVTFGGSTGDSNGAPDIGPVTVSSNANKQIVFQIATDQPTLPANGAVLVYVDADQNASTGTGNDGIDYLIGLDSSGVTLIHWTGALTTVPAPTLTGTYANGLATISINSSDLGGTSGFNFFVGSLANESQGMNGLYDNAPDVGVWNYQLPAGSPAQTGTLTLFVDAFQISAAPRAGRPFVVTLVASRSDTGAFVGTDGQLRCDASASGHPLRAQSLSSSVKIGNRSVAVQGCGWQLPRSLRGKKLTGSITLTVEGTSVTRRFAARIK